jgi:hypothetical protein
LKIEPGVYDLGNGSLLMKPFVDVEGSGEAVTRIRALGHATNDLGTVQLAPNSELRLLTSESTGGSAYAKAVYVHAGSPRITHVTVMASGATNENQGLYTDNGATPVVTDLTASATASGSANSFAVLDVGSSSQLFHVTANASGGAFSRGIFGCCGATPIVRHSVAVASGATTENHGIAMYGASPTLEYATGVATGAATNNLGVLLNGASAPVLRHVTCRAIGATVMNWGCLSNGSAEPDMSDIDALASGGTTARGLDDDSLGVGASLSHVRAAGSGGSGQNAGVRIANCSPRAVDVEAFANGGGTSGVYGLLIESASPDVTQLSATGGGSTTQNTAGVWVTGPTSAPVLSHLRATATGQTAWGLFTTPGNGITVNDGAFTAASPLQAVGLWTDGNAVLADVTASVSGAGTNTGVYLQNPTNVRVTNATVDVSAGAGARGLFVAGTAGTVRVDRSTLAAPSFSIINSNASTLRVGVSQLGGPVSNGGGGILNCIGSYSATNVVLGSACN